MERVYPDTNVLFPISVCDLVLRLAEIDVHQVLWSDYLLHELEEKLVERRRCTADSARKICDAIRHAFPEGEVERSRYEALMATMTGPDADDHEHSAVAAAGGATVILSSDTAGFPARDLSPHGIVRREPDAYLSDLLGAFPRGHGRHRGDGGGQGATAHDGWRRHGRTGGRRPDPVRNNGTNLAGRPGVGPQLSRRSVR